MLGSGHAGGRARGSFGTIAMAIAISSPPPARPRGVGAGHVCDRANTEEMNRHLAEIAAKVQPGGHAIVILDGAGWHRSKALEIPPELSLLRLPPYSPELNSMENVFDYLKSNFLANRLFPTVEDARNAVLQAWTYFSEQPALITSIMSRDWAIVRAAAA